MVGFVSSCSTCISLQIFPLNFCRWAETVYHTSVPVQSSCDGQHRVRHRMRSSSRAGGSVGEQALF